MNTGYLDEAKHAFEDLKSLAPSLKQAIALGKEQASTRDGVIQSINEMCDTLQLASDLIAKELSASIVEFNQIKSENESLLRSYFQRLAIRFSDSTLRLKLHEGSVCGELHKLGDRFVTPFSPQAISGLSFWDNVNAFFRRSSKMSRALDGLVGGEEDCLTHFTRLVNEIRNRAENATGLPRGQEAEMRQEGELLMELMRDKRTVLETEVASVRRAAKAVVKTLH